MLEMLPFSVTCNTTAHLLNATSNCLCMLGEALDAVHQLMQVLHFWQLHLNNKVADELSAAQHT